jgi:hypothetical protein
VALENIIEAVINRDGKGGGESLIIANHLAQLKLFGARGIECYPVQDDAKGTRKSYIQGVWKYNRMDLYLDYIWDLYLSCGEVLFYLRPTGKTYEISWYHGGTTDPAPEFKTYYKPGGRELESVIIAYPYKIRSNLGMEEERWVKLTITAEKIERRDLMQRPNLNGTAPDEVSSTVEIVDNSLGFVPNVVVPNHPSRPGQPGTSEFHWLRKPLERHDEMLRTINRNLSMFANPTLVTTRSKGEVMDAAGNPMVPTVATQSGYYPSTNRSDPRERFSWDGGEKVAAVIGGVAADERFGYIQVDPVSGDQNTYQQQYREQLHTAMGGTDPLGVRSGATAYEMKIRSGQTAATARKKCLALYDYGICKLLEMVLQAEESLFKQSLLQFATERLKDFQKLLVALFGEKGIKTSPKDFVFEKPDDISDEICQLLDEAGAVPPGVIGLVPLGDRTIEWRFTSEIFPDTSREILDKSIVGRNLAEAGINTEHVLRFLFPDKTEKEINAMQEGNFSYRTAQNKAAAINQLLGLYQSFMQVPDPDNPGLPLAARLNPVPILEQALGLLAQEFSYGTRYDPVDEVNNTPGVNSTNSIYQPINNEITNGSSRTPNPSPNPNYYAPGDVRGSAAAAGIGSFPTEPMGQPPGFTPGVAAEFASPIPTPGGTVSRTLQQSPGLSSRTPVPGLPADVAVSPELWAIYQSQQQPSSDGSSARDAATTRARQRRS